MRHIILSLIILISSTVFAQQPDTAFYSVVGNGFITGVQKSWKENKNEHHYIYYYNDRGRGENVSETIVASDDGRIISSSTSGVDYFKSPYTSSFSASNDSVVWITNGVRKAKRNKKEIYNQNIAPGAKELVLSWTLMQAGHKSYILPDDSIKVDEPLTKTVTYNNKTITLKLIANYNGRNPAPIYTWMTDNMRFFATLTTWSGVIAKGYEKWADTLLALQEKEAAGYFASQVKQYSTTLKKHLLIIHVTLFNSATATTQSNMSVDVMDGKIISIFSSDEKTNLHADTVIDAKGKFLMPGLWDMHSHFAKEDGVWYLAGGVTHVRDMGNAEIIQTWQQQIRANQLLGPDISYLSGLIDKEDPLQAPGGKIVSGLEKALEAVDYYHQKGYNQIKLYSSIKPVWVKPIAERAHKLGMRVAGHVPAYMNAAQAINAGYNEITHINMIFLNFLGADTLPTNGIARLRVPGQLAGRVNLDSKEVRSFIQLMKTKAIAHDPTLSLQEAMYTEYIGDTSHAYKPIISWLPGALQKDIANTSSMAPQEQKTSYVAAYKNYMRMVKLLYDNGILLVAGTDGGDAIALHRELEDYNLAGIPANQVLKIATYNAARDCSLENVYGQIKPGRDADLILIDGNPAKNISDIRRVEWVIKNGRMYSPKKLYASQGWKYYY